MSNPNFPRIEESIALGQGGVGGSQPFGHWLDITSRTRATNSLTRGKQYELDTIQSAEYDVTIDNTDGAFDPTNSSSVYYPQVVPWVPYRKRAQWPVTNNLLSPELALPSTTNINARYLIQGANTTVTVVSTAPVYTGTLTYSCAVASQGSGTALMGITGMGIIPNAQYDFSAYGCNLTSSGSLSLAATIQWIGPDDSITSTVTGFPVTFPGSASNTTFLRIGVAATAPANACGANLLITTTNTITGTGTIHFGGLQLEHGTSGTTWVAPGIWYDLVVGFVERWPQAWDLSGTRSVMTPTVVDQMAWLSQADLPDGLLAAIQSPTSGVAPPDFVYTLGDSEGSATFVDSQGNYSPATIQTGGASGAGIIAPGTAVTATDQTGAWAAGDQTVTNIAVGSGGTPGSNAAGPYSGISIPASQSTGKHGPTGTAVSGWTRMIAYRTTSSVAGQTIWDSEAAAPFGANLPSQIVTYTYTSGGQPQTQIILVVDGVMVWNAAYGAAPVGDWNLIFFGVEAGGNTAFFSGSYANQLNGVATASISSSPWTTQALGSDIIGVSANAARVSFNVLPFQGDVAYAAQWPYALSYAQISQIWNFWSGEIQSTDQRYGSILSMASYMGTTALDSGITRDMGPALDISGVDILTALQGCVVAEAGQHYVSRTGALTFKSRQARMNKSPTLTFGDDVANGEIPFVNPLQVDYDDTQIINDCQVTQYSSNNVYYGENAASKAAYGTRTNQTTINVVLAQECQDMANGLSSVFGQPQPHVTSITVYPGRLTPSIANAWGSLLSLDLGQCVKVVKRTVGRAPFQMTGFIEQITWDFSPSDASVTLQITSSAMSQYWQLAALHTTLSASVSAGATSIALAAPAVANSLTPGISLELAPGTASQETVTIASISGNTLTLTSPVAHSHSSGTVVCDVLPSGITDPTTWDAYSILDSTAILSY